MENTLDELADKILHKMEPAIEKAIEKHVNGKIKALDFKFDAYIKEDLAWKETALPVIQSGTKVLNFGTVGMAMLKFVSVLAGAILAVYAFFNWTK